MGTQTSSLLLLLLLLLLFVDSSWHSEVGVRAAGPFPGKEFRHLHLPLGGYHGRTQTLRCAQHSAGKLATDVEMQ